MMKLVVALFFILNVALLVWMQTLPNDSAVLRAVLAEDVGGDIGANVAGKIGALEMQVRAARQYQGLFGKHQTANKVARVLLLANACIFFLGSLLLAMEAKGSESSEPRAVADGEDAAAQP